MKGVRLVTASKLILFVLLQCYKKIKDYSDKLECHDIYTDAFSNCHVLHKWIKNIQQSATYKTKNSKKYKRSLCVSKRRNHLHEWINSTSQIIIITKKKNQNPFSTKLFIWSRSFQVKIEPFLFSWLILPIWASIFHWALSLRIFAKSFATTSIG